VIDVTDRHPATVHIVKYFAWDHLNDPLAEVSRIFEHAVSEVLARVEDGPELTVSLRKMLEAKDAAVRAAL